eukprot:CAMPEP_0172479824 /NCGR_PEP_ID=MMETSP1066-20121228/4651_1 /TAXON_ID=671091 /ORGANISM="Coscinodiscus wailesii, Strain CCMP2513" /LENGTH=140 /DNA_ID=CAMNT_0013240627 /DNA_START=257 /DNA_END=676 /DNA_ORIENTATION=+
MASFSRCPQAVGVCVGVSVGLCVLVGFNVGTDVGVDVGSIVGVEVGDIVGRAVVGFIVGVNVGFIVGIEVGDIVGRDVIGALEGDEVVGDTDDANDGDQDCIIVGLDVGISVGCHSSIPLISISRSPHLLLYVEEPPCKR